MGWIRETDDKPDRRPTDVLKLVAAVSGTAVVGVWAQSQSAVDIDLFRVLNETADNVKKTIALLQSELPPDVKISVAQDASIFTRNSLTDVQSELTMAVVLTGLVLLVFLHSFRSTLIVLLAIPTSLIATLGVMYFMGFTLNMMTTLALSLSAWRGFYHWLTRRHGFKANQLVGLRAPKAKRPLPKALSVDAAQRLLEGEEGTAVDLARDRAMFELLYSSGLRLGELVALNVDDGRLDLRQAEVTVTGKGAKTRTVPVGARAREALKDWIDKRNSIAAPNETGEDMFPLLARFVRQVSERKQWCPSRTGSGLISAAALRSRTASPG